MSEDREPDSDDPGDREPNRADHDEQSLDDGTAASASPEESPAQESPNESEPMATDTAAEDEQSMRTRVERYVRYLLVAGLSLLALIAMLRFYFAASTTIDTWISQDYRSLFQALFNLAILLLAGAGIGWQARKIR